MDDPFLDPVRWRALLDKEGLPATDVHVGVLRRSDFDSRRGALLVWRGTLQGVEVSLRDYDGDAGNDIGMLLVIDDGDAAGLMNEGLTRIPLLVHRGRLRPYMLMTMEKLEKAGLADFVEDLGLVFPKH